MTKCEELKGRGFFFYMFTTPEARATWREDHPDTFEFAEVDEVFLARKFPVYFLGVKRLHHTPVKYTPPGGLL